MVFASPIFLFLFLPLTLAAYFALPRRWRNAVLLVASLVFYVWGEARYVALVLASVAFNWVIGAAIGGAARTHARTRWLALGVAGNLCCSACSSTRTSRSPTSTRSRRCSRSAPIALAAIPLPLGISFFTFHAISYVVDVYSATPTPSAASPRFALYILLFPQLIAGPIIRWQATSPRRLRRASSALRRLRLRRAPLHPRSRQEGARSPTRSGASPIASSRCRRGELTDAARLARRSSATRCRSISISRATRTWRSASCACSAFASSRTSTIPTSRAAIREFWRRWHISLSNWFRDYLYIPLGGNQRGDARARTSNLVIVFLLCGLWHGASWTFVLWGVWHGAVPGRRARRTRSACCERAWRPLAHVYALAAVMGGWVLFRCDTLAHAGAFYAALLGGGAAAAPLHPLADVSRCPRCVHAHRGRRSARRRSARAIGSLARSRRDRAPGSRRRRCRARTWAWLAVVLIAVVRRARRRHLQSVHLLPLLSVIRRLAAARISRPTAPRPAWFGTALSCAVRRHASSSRWRDRCARRGAVDALREPRARAAAGDARQHRIVRTYPRTIRARLRRPLRHARAARSPRTTGARARCSACRRCPT